MNFLVKLVRPVAIAAEAKFGINLTLGCFIGILLQLLANRSGINSPNRLLYGGFC